MLCRFEVSHDNTRSEEREIPNNPADLKSVFSRECLRCFMTTKGTGTE